MTRKLESLFDLPLSTPAEDEPTPQPAEDFRAQLQTLDDTIDKIDQALPGVRGLEANDKEMDSLVNFKHDFDQSELPMKKNEKNGIRNLAKNVKHIT